MANQFSKYNSEYVLKNFFKDRDTYNFKHGLEVGLSSNMGQNSTGNAIMNLDEDPTIFGFDIVILNGSSLFNDMESFFQFGEDNNITDIIGRTEIYNDFIKQFSKFFNVDDSIFPEFKLDGKFNSFKSHYLNGILGLSKLIHSNGVGGKNLAKTDKKEMTDFGTDKLTVKLSEDVGVNGGYLAATYRNFIYSKKNGRQVIPENLLRFDMAIIVSEIRNFNKVSNAYAKVSVETDSIKQLKDNVSRYIFTLYDCQFDFNDYSFEDEISQAGFGESAPDVSKGLSFDIYYKYVGFEMEKMDFHVGTREENGLLDQVKYINDQRDALTTNQLRPDSELSITTGARNSNKFPVRPMDVKYQMSTKYNTEDSKSYEFDFPMIKAQNVVSEIELRNRNLKVRNNESFFRSGVNRFIDDANQRTQRFFIQARSKLISDLAAKVRDSTGLRNIAYPTNVYENSTLGQVLLGQVSSFANITLNSTLGTGAGYLTKFLSNKESIAFNGINDTAERLKGYEPIPRGSFATNQGDSSIPNIYRNKL